MILLSPVIITTSDTVENRPLRRGMAWWLGPSWSVTLLHKFEFPFDHLSSYDVIRLHVQIHIIHYRFFCQAFFVRFFVRCSLFLPSCTDTGDSALLDGLQTLAGNEEPIEWDSSVDCYQGPCESTWVNVCTTCVQSLNLTKLPEWIDSSSWRIVKRLLKPIQSPRR